MISVWQRVQRVWRANAHASVDRLEQPEAMLNQLQRELIAGLTAAKTALAQSRAWQARLRAQLDELARRGDAAGNAAQRAVAQGDDDVARQAVARRQRCAAETQTLARQLTQAESLTTRQQDQLAKLKRELVQLKEKRASLMQRERFARSMQTVTQINEEMTEPINLVLERMEDKVEMHEARAEALTDDPVDDQPELDNYLAQQSVDDELAHLKAQLNSQSGETA